MPKNMCCQNVYGQQKCCTEKVRKKRWFKNNILVKMIVNLPNNLKYEEELKCKDNLKFEDDLKCDDNLEQTKPSPIHILDLRNKPAPTKQNKT